LTRAVEIDEDFVAGYVGLTEVYENCGEEEEKYTEIAWRKTLKKFPQWPPEELNWGLIKNRQYFRAICNKAMLKGGGKRRKQNWSKIENLFREENKKHKFFKYPAEDLDDEIGKPMANA